MDPVTTHTPNELMVVFSNTVSAGFDALNGAANGVFGLMIALVVALTGIQWALSPHRDVLAAGFAKVLLIGFFAFVINDWQSLSQTMFDGFIHLGLAAGGGSLSRSEFLNPGEVLEQGWRIVKAIGDAPAPLNNPVDVMGNLSDALILGLAMIGIMLAFAVLALQIIVAFLEFKIVTLGGFVLLPFGIWSRSAFLAERPLGFVASSGLKILALAIVVSGARAVFDQLQPSANPDMYEALAILAAALLLAMLAIFIPNLAAALVTGGPALGAGAAVTGGLAVAGAGALAGGAVAAAGAAVAGRSPQAALARAAAGADAGRPPPASPAAAGGPPRQGPGGPGAPPPPSPRTPGAGQAPRPSGAPAPESPTAAGGGPALAPRRSASDGEGRASETAGRPAPVVAAEQARARRDFHRAAAEHDGSVGRSSGAAWPPGSRRSAALQTFFTANAGRSLLPGSETSGAITPTLKPEEP